jgi:hypothetical protein
MRVSDEEPAVGRQDLVTGDGEAGNTLFRYNRTMGWLLNRVTDWLRRLLSQNLLAKGQNPEKYERIRCPVCHGTGLPTEDRLGGWKDTGARHCGVCHGQGWVLAGREPGVPHDTGETRQRATIVVAEARADESSGASGHKPSHPPDPPDAPSAPAAPLPPEGLDYL